MSYEVKFFVIKTQIEDANTLDLSMWYGYSIKLDHHAANAAPQRIKNRRLCRILP